ncbi:peptide MFS transporter [Sphingosinicella microcystinivorans]|uniref:MFS transporter n=1 Tax=Sphingosinicella microcystinivorans TaxID=335406 RepID=A0AAD1D5J7_SPHMI|nr:peptide MFS transporter [Sphingosinicella microcystinivorans]RKS91084.1 POT family proton-dependent oligopeptide transporter [Sphingosinicella microcystinivorans]BBE34005.1 MFS transporter [Sphingosinicella microcystinivorans]
MAIASTAPVVQGEEQGILGHPKGLAYLAFTEAWERLSFYGMSSLLLLYIIQRLLTPDVVGSVLALGRLRTGIETLTGPLSDQAFASQVFSLYSGLVYFTPVFGGMLADRLLGQRRTVVLGALLMIAGHVLMAFDASFLIALSLLILGTGCLKGNISAQVGQLYAPGDEGRRTRAFAIFYVAINTGALLGPLVCGILAQVYGWHVGFGTAGALMLFALVIYGVGWKHLPPDRKRQQGVAAPMALAARDWRVIAALLFAGAIGILPTAAYFQEMNAGLLFIEASVDREVFGWTIPATSFNALDGLFCIMSVPLLIVLWQWQAKRGREPRDLSKITIGYLIIAAANLIMVVPAGSVDRGDTVSAFWPVALYALNALGFIFYWPTQLALYARAAPAQVNSTMMGILFLSVFLGNLLVGRLAGLWEILSHAHFFALHAALAFAAFLVMLVVMRPIGKLLAQAGPENQP